MEQCIKCKKNYKTLTKEGLCAFCYKNKHGKWSEDFTDHSKKRR